MICADCWQFITRTRQALSKCCCCARHHVCTIETQKCTSELHCLAGNKAIVFLFIHCMHMNYTSAHLTNKCTYACVGASFYCVS